MPFNSSGFSENRLRLLVLLQVMWLLTILILGTWWGHIISEQSELIYTLTINSGVDENAALLLKNKTDRMIYWELFTFIFFILGSSILMFLLYWKDLKRTRGLAHFFSALTHEIKTPLTSIKLQAETLGDLLHKDTKANTLISRLLEDTEKLENQVIRSLELARLEGGGKLYLQNTHLLSILKKVSREFTGTRSNAQNLIIHINCDDNINILADEHSLDTILRNFLNNSLTHNKIRPIEASIRVNETKHSVILDYSDNGELLNININQLGSLFSRGLNSKGAGIGLYLCRLLTEKMNGTITFSKKKSLHIEVELKKQTPGIQFNE